MADNANPGAAEPPAAGAAVETPPAPQPAVEVEDQFASEEDAIFDILERGGLVEPEEGDPTPGETPAAESKEVPPQPPAEAEGEKETPAEPAAEAPEVAEGSLKDLNPDQRQRVSDIIAERTGKLAGQRKEAEEASQALGTERDQLRDDLGEVHAELTQLREGQAVAPRTAEQPLSHIKSQKALRMAAQAARDTVKWCRAHPDGGVATVKGKEIEITAERVQELMDNISDELQFDFPERGRFLDTEAQYSQHAVELMPELADPKTPLAQEVAEAVSVAPEVLLMPAWRLWVAQQRIGQAVMEGRLTHPTVARILNAHMTAAAKAAAGKGTPPADPVQKGKIPVKPGVTPQPVPALSAKPPPLAGERHGRAQHWETEAGKRDLTDEEVEEALFEDFTASGVV